VSMKTSTIVADLPKVNLLPPEIFERRLLRHVQIGVGVAVLAAIAGVSYLFVAGNHDVAKAKSQLATANEKTAALQRQIQRYSDVGRVSTQLASTNAMLAQATGTEVKWSVYLADLSVVIPQSSWLTGMTVSESLQPGTIASAAQAPAEIGKVTMRGNTMNWLDLATYLDALQPEPGLSNPSFSQADEKFIGAHKVVTFTSSAGVTSAALCASSPGGC
jgi:Tfp pilus assembly protein PilN